jgi:ATP-binding cassette subfamily B protein
MGGGTTAGRPGTGLPFGGIPYELQAGVDRLLADEPEYDDTPAGFTQVPTDEERRTLTFRRLLTQYPRMLTYAAMSVLLVGLAQQAGPLLTGIAVNHGMVKGHQNFGVVIVVAVLYLVCTGIAAIGQRWQARVTGRLAAWVMNDLRVKVFVHLQRLSLDFFTEEKSGVVMSRMTSDIENLQQLMQDGLAQFALQGLTMVVITVILLVLDVRLALITVLIIVPITTVLTLWFRRESELGYDRVRDGIANVLADLSESLHGVRVVTAHNRQRHNIVHHRNVVGDYRAANDYTAQINAVYGPSTQMIGYLGQAALLAIGGDMVINHSMSIGTLFSFFLFLNRFFQPIQLLVQQYNSFQQGRASILKLRGLLATKPSVTESPDAVELPPIEGEISFAGVSFGYRPGVPVIHDVDLTIRPGETVAFVGPTGAGKSTLAKLVTRFYDPTAGHVLIDGHDLRSVTLASLRRQLGVVPQEPFLFAGTLRDNVAFARPDASDEVVWDAVRTVGLLDVVQRLPDGIHTIVHERGQSLSSGERQLIALARAFVARPRVLVLDEATSNLDLQSETKIEAALDTLLQDRTAVLIAHRLSTAMRADRIVVVDDGQIAEIGTPLDLVSRGGRFAEMYQTWMSQTG